MTVQVDNKPVTRRRRALVSFLAAAMTLSGGVALTQAPSAHAAGETVAVTTTTVEQGDYLWFTMAGFAAKTTVKAYLADARGEVKTAPVQFTIGADGKPENPDGQTYQRLLVPRDLTTVKDGYHVVTYGSAGNEIAQSKDVSVTAATRKVTNPGDHQGGVEKASVSRGSVWTFNAKKFTPNGKLTAKATIDGVANTVLDGIGQNAQKQWPLNSYGDTTGVVRVKIPASVTAPTLDVTFSDGTNTIVRTLTIDAPAQATAEAKYANGKITVSGSGWVHPTANTGSLIAFKIDDGAYSLPVGDEAIHPQTGKPIMNRTVWYAALASAEGDFTVTFDAPEGLWKDGNEHSVRLLSGSLHQVPGDASRSVKAPLQQEVTARR